MDLNLTPAQPRQAAGFRIVELPMVDRMGDEMRDLLQAAWSEARPAWLPERCSPDGNVLGMAERAGVYFTLAAYAAVDDRLVGYATGLAHRDLQSDIKVCDGFGLHVDPAYRTSPLIGALLAAFAASSAARGATVVQWHVAAGTTLDEYLCESHYQRQRQTTYALILGT